MSDQNNELDYEVLKLIVALRHYQGTQKGLFFLHQAVDRVMVLLERKPELRDVMHQLGLLVHSNGDTPRK